MIPDTANHCVRGPVRHRTVTVPDPILHRPTTSEFVRPLLPVTADAFAQLSTLGIPPEDEMNDYLGNITPQATLSRFYAALEFLCPAIWGVPLAIPQTGFRPQAERYPAQRSYTWIGTDIWKAVKPWFREFQPGYELPPFNLDACGSPFTPTREAVAGIVNVLTTLLKRSPWGDLDAELRSVNAQSAILQLLLCLFGGGRNWPTEIPPWYVGSGQWMIGREKITSLYMYPEPLVKIATRCSQRRWDLLGRLKNQGMMVNDSLLIDSVHHIFCIKNCGEGLHVEREPLKASTLTFALLACPETQPYGGLHPASMRHFTMTELYAAGFCAHDIERFHHRSLECMNSLSIERLEDPRMPLTTSRMHAFLVNLIGM
jgi:hypothetical protein